MLGRAYLSVFLEKAILICGDKRKTAAWFKSGVVVLSTGQLRAEGGSLYLNYLNDLNDRSYCREIVVCSDWLRDNKRYSLIYIFQQFHFANDKSELMHM